RRAPGRGRQAGTDAHALGAGRVPGDEPAGSEAVDDRAVAEADGGEMTGVGHGLSGRACPNFIVGVVAVCALFAVVNAQPPAPNAALVDKYCVGCHNDRAKAGNLVLAGLDSARPADHPAEWEKVVRKVRAGLMPPAGMPRPDRATLDAFAE